jgi:hypothetical protein
MQIDITIEDPKAYTKPFTVRVNHQLMPDTELMVFENHHQGAIAAYLVNCLVPCDRDIRVAAQNRDQQQSFYQMDYVQAGPSTNTLSGMARRTRMVVSGRASSARAPRISVATGPPDAPRLRASGDNFD